MQCLIQGDDFSREKSYCPLRKPLKNVLLVVFNQRILSCKHKVSESIATEIKSNPRYLNYEELNLLVTLGMGTRGFFSRAVRSLRRPKAKGTSGAQKNPLGPRVLLAASPLEVGGLRRLKSRVIQQLKFLTLKAECFDTLTVKQWEIMINNDLLLFSATDIYPTCRRPLPFSFVARLHAN